MTHVLKTEVVGERKFVECVCGLFRQEVFVETPNECAYDVEWRAWKRRCETDYGQNVARVIESAERAARDYATAKTHLHMGKKKS